MNAWNIESAFPNYHFDITPSDVTNLPRPMVIYCVADGDAVLVDKAGTAYTYTMVAGQIIPMQVERVNATGTTATVVGLY